jgi:hypothetical protein
MTQRREIDWQTRWLEVTITKTKTLLFFAPAPRTDFGFPASAAFSQNLNI